MRKSTVASIAALSIGISIVGGAPAQAADRSGAERLNIPNGHACKAGRTVMQGMVAGPGGQLYIVFTEGGGNNPILSRWVRDGSAWDGASWLCAETKALALGHGNDVAYNANYPGVGKALLVTMGTESAHLSDDIAIVSLNADGSIGSAQTVDLPMNISGLCYSATAEKYAARRGATLWTHPATGSLASGWTTVKNGNLPVHDNRADQGLDCSENYIWSAQSITTDSSAAASNWVYQYTWSGSLVEKIEIPGNGVLGVDREAREVEDVTHIGSDFFVGINRNMTNNYDSVHVLTE